MKRALGVVWLTLAACGGDSEAPEAVEDAEVPPAEVLDASLRDASLRDSSVNASDTSVAPLDATPADTCTMGTPKLTVTAVRVQGTASKGEPLKLEVELSNTGGGAMVSVTPELTAQRFRDYEAVPLATTKALACPGTTRVVVEGGPFLSKGDKQYALGSGKYDVALKLDDTRVDSSSIEIATSGALLVPVVYDQRYLDGIQNNPHKTPEAFLLSSFTRPNEIFTPSGNDPDGAGKFQSFPKGFDEMMKVTHHFKSFPGFPGEKTTSEGWCEDAAAYATTTLGLGSAWASNANQRHGFDYLIALTPDMGGGVACGWLDVQVSSFINRDLDRQQIIAVHESGHIFGAPHCDDVGNGSGGSLQGYVMCSGEKHEHYPEQLVWHKTSIDKMKSHWQ